MTKSSGIAHILLALAVGFGLIAGIRTYSVPAFEARVLPTWKYGPYGDLMMAPDDQTSRSPKSHVTGCEGENCRF